jgi:N-acetylneuraminic acid mutarotase
MCNRFSYIIAEKKTVIALSPTKKDEQPRAGRSINGASGARPAATERCNLGCGILSLRPTLGLLWLQENHLVKSRFAPQLLKGRNMRHSHSHSSPDFRGSRWVHFIGCFSFSVLLASCGGGSGDSSTPPPVTYTANSSVAQKGPLIKGSTVTAQELDASLSPTGQQFSYQITSDLGTFSPTSTFASQYIGLNATGYYFDEVANAVSTGTVTLNGYNDLATESVLNVNLLTTLAYQRIQHLVTALNMTFAAAEAQAETEVLTALNIPASNYGSFGTLDLGGGMDGDYILAAVSSLFVYGNSAGPLSQLIANFQADIGTNGIITSAATKAALASAGKSVNPTAVAANLTQAYSSVGVTFTAADISNWIDQDGDGVIGKFKFQVPDATPSTAFTFPSFVVTQVAGSSISVSTGQLSINGTPVTGAVAVNSGDVIAVSPGVGSFPNGVLTSYLSTGGARVARVSFTSGLVSITVTPANPSIANGLTQQFTATGTFSDTSTANLTSSVMWTSRTSSIAMIDFASGLAQATTAGSTVITATSGSVSGSTTLTVTPAILQSISITPNPAFVGVGFTTQLTATGIYSDETTANVTNIATWTSDTPTAATVGPTTGLATSVSPGSTTISAAVGLVGGTASLTVVANAWTPTGSLKTGREGHTATLLPNGTVLVTGGDIDSLLDKTNSAEIYNPVSDVWSPTGSLPVAVVGQSATLLQNGKVLVAGGLVNQFELSGTTSAELYDPATGTWTLTGSLPIPIFNVPATLLQNGQVLLGNSELYDPVAGTWSATGSLHFANDGLGTLTLLPNGKVLATDGINAELYDPVAGTWSLTGNLTTPRSASFTATLLSNGMVLVAGGVSAGDTDLAAAELYDPVAGTWSATGSLTTARAAHTATLLPSGQVLIAGGIATGGGVTSSSELYDPVAGTWSPTGSLGTARDGHTATLLQNGVVLVTGGPPATTNLCLASSELYW